MDGAEPPAFKEYWEGVFGMVVARLEVDGLPSVGFGFARFLGPIAKDKYEQQSEDTGCGGSVQVAVRGHDWGFAWVCPVVLLTC